MLHFKAKRYHDWLNGLKSNLPSRKEWVRIANLPKFLYNLANRYLFLSQHFKFIRYAPEGILSLHNDTLYYIMYYIIVYDTYYTLYVIHYILYIIILYITQYIILYIIYYTLHIIHCITYMLILKVYRKYKESKWILMYRLYYLVLAFTWLSKCS